jgi:hypothetical protein
MKKFFLLLALFSLIVVTTSCQKPAEVTLTKYFQAMSHNDRDSMSSMAVEPKNIEYKSYKIVSIGEPEIVAYDLSSLVEQERQMTQDMQAKAREAGDKRDEMLDLEDELDTTRSRSGKRKLRQQIEEAEAAFKAAEAGYKDFVKQRAELRKKIEVEKSLVKLSASIDSRAEIYTGNVEKTRADVKITLPDDTVKDYVFILIRYKFVVEERELPNRLVILKIQTVEDFEADMAAAAEEKEMTSEEVAEEQPAEEKNEEGGENPQ